VLANIADTRAGNAASRFDDFIQNEGRLQEALDIWPPNRGRIGPVESVELQPGFMIDRYGLPRGKFVSPQGTPFSDRALPPSYLETKPFFEYEVVKPIPDVIQSRALPWFNQRGMGPQLELPKTVQWYLENGYLQSKGG
jgi:filamentous hemagglutinin